jgi:replicative DNA helicase
MIESTIPQAYEVEQAVLGAMLLDPAALAYGLDALGTDEVFYAANHQLIFTALGRLFDEGTPADQVTLSTELTRMGQLERAGGVVYLAQILSEVASAANIRYHVKILLDRYARRSVQRIGRKLDLEAPDLSLELEQITAAADAGLSSLHAMNPGGLVPIEAEVSDLLAEISEAAKRDDKMLGLSTGLASLDLRLCGLQPASLVLLAARPSVGKTALACQIALHVAQAHRERGTVAFFSVEMALKEILTRMLCYRLRIEFNRLRLGRLQDREWLEAVRGIGQVAQLPVHIDQTGGLSILEARTRARLLARKQPISLVVVDYLQLMTGHGDNREQEISSVSRGLKALAKEVDAPVLALSQMSRDIERRGSKVPQLSDLRDSGSLEQDADVVIFLSDPQGDESPEIEVSIAKSRNGPKGLFPLYYERQFFSFADMAPTYRTEPPGDEPAEDWRNR